MSMLINWVAGPAHNLPNLVRPVSEALQILGGNTSEHYE